MQGNEKIVKWESEPWWKKTTVYQIYPRSFMDTTGNGIGDLKGIISKLDYLKDLGVETIWFSPFYKSPFEDMGYDISDYRDICEDLGTMQDTEELIDEIHSRDMKVVFDMVLNHTSDKHPWFIESRSSRDNPKRDWYIWLDGKKPGGKKPPNNWRSVIGGSGWNYDKTTDQWYWAQFLPFQPDLNYRNPEVKKEMFDILKFWLDKKVDGFRLDMINAIYEDPEFRDNPFRFKLLPSQDDPDFLFRSSIYIRDHPDTIKFSRELRALIDSYHNPDRFLVGEVSGPLPILRKYVGEDGQSNGLNLAFLFQSLGAPMKAKAFKKLIKKYEAYFSEPFIPTWVFGNHDRARRISRYGGNLLMGKLNCALQLTARGVPFIYYGEEIGMERIRIPVKKSQDAVALKYKNIPQFIFDIVWKIAKESLNRDECRTPMQWSGEENAGFSPPNVKTWLPITHSYKERNVKTEESDPDSILNCYKRFLKLRRELAALQIGNIELLKIKGVPKSVLAYKRSAVVEDKLQTIYVFLNFSAKGTQFKCPSQLFKTDNQVKEVRLYASTYHESPMSSKDTTLDGTFIQIQLKPWEGIVLGS
ncbi:MAG: alpha-glucosidase [Promethearchaeota archaeon]